MESHPLALVPVPSVCGRTHWPAGAGAPQPGLDQPQPLLGGKQTHFRRKAGPDWQPSGGPMAGHGVRGPQSNGALPFSNNGNTFAGRGRRGAEKVGCCRRGWVLGRRDRVWEPSHLLAPGLKDDRERGGQSRMGNGA